MRSLTGDRETEHGEARIRPHLPMVDPTTDHKAHCPTVGRSSQDPMVVWFIRAPCDDTDLVTKQKAAHWGGFRPIRKLLFLIENIWLRGQDLNLRPLGYEPNELPGCSTPRLKLAV